jgi:hypothetical protein
MQDSYVIKWNQGQFIIVLLRIQQNTVSAKLLPAFMGFQFQRLLVKRLIIM